MFHSLFRYLKERDKNPVSGSSCIYCIIIRQAFHSSGQFFINASFGKCYKPAFSLVKTFTYDKCQKRNKLTKLAGLFIRKEMHTFLQCQKISNFLLLKIVFHINIRHTNVSGDLWMGNEV